MEYTQAVWLSMFIGFIIGFTIKYKFWDIVLYFISLVVLIFSLVHAFTDGGWWIAMFLYSFVVLLEEIAKNKKWCSNIVSLDDESYIDLK